MPKQAHSLEQAPGPVRASKGAFVAVNVARCLDAGQQKSAVMQPVIYDCSVAGATTDPTKSRHAHKGCASHS